MGVLAPRLCMNDWAKNPKIYCTSHLIFLCALKPHYSNYSNHVNRLPSMHIICSQSYLNGKCSHPYPLTDGQNWKMDPPPDLSIVSRIVKANLPLCSLRVAMLILIGGFIFDLNFLLRMSFWNDSSLISYCHPYIPSSLLQWESGIFIENGVA
jgi:hypothetical protein